MNISNRAGPQSETAVAIDPLNADHLLAAANSIVSGDSMVTYESFDGGRTWADAGLTLAPTFCYDPWLDFSVRFDPVTQAYTSWPVAGYECSDQRIAYRKPGTTTWVKTKFSASLAGTIPDRDMVISDDTPSSPFFGSVYVGFDDNGNSNTAYVIYTRDLSPAIGGVVWKRSARINDVSGPTIGVNVSVGPDGTLYATWEDYNGGKIYADRSTDGGATWGPDRVVTNYRAPTESFFVKLPPQAKRGVLPMPFGAAAPAGTTFAGRFYVVYWDLANAPGVGTDVFVRYSDDGGQTWSAERAVNDNQLPRWDVHPAIAVAPDGTIGVSFYDTRGDPAALAVDRYATFSSDGGATWSPNLRVSSASSGDWHPLNSDANQYGDYEGIAAGPTGGFYAVWTDARAGNNQEEMYGAAIDVSTSGSIPAAHVTG